MMHGRWPATSWVHYTTSCNTQSSAPEDGQNYRLKHVELIGIINKLLLLHLVGCLYYCIPSTFNCHLLYLWGHQMLKKKIAYHFKNHKTLGFHTSSVSQDSGLPGCDAVSLGELFLTFQGYTVPPHSIILEPPDNRRWQHDNPWKRQEPFTHQTFMSHKN